MNRLCSGCKRLLSEGEFNWKIKGVKRSYYCRKCSRSYTKRHYIENREYYLQKAKKRNHNISVLVHDFIGEYLMNHPCVDCGEKDILVLEFDHIERNTKRSDVSLLVRGGHTLNTIKQEVVKCQVRCANCHHRKTAIEVNSWKLKYAPVA